MNKYDRNEFFFVNGTQEQRPLVSINGPNEFWCALH